MVREIRTFIKERKIISMQDLSIHFKMDKSALEPIIDRLELSGDIKKGLDQKCAGCADNCAFAGEPMIIIEWAKKNKEIG